MSFLSGLNCYKHFIHTRNTDLDSLWWCSADGVRNLKWIFWNFFTAASTQWCTFHFMQDCGLYSSDHFSDPYFRYFTKLNLFMSVTTPKSLISRKLYEWKSCSNHGQRKGTSADCGLRTAESWGGGGSGGRGGGGGAFGLPKIFFQFGPKIRRGSQAPPVDPSL